MPIEYSQGHRDKPLISLCVITKNEEKTLPGCLSSVKNLVDEMIVVDTGSTDQTTAIAESLGAKVFFCPWKNDFAYAKNQPLSHATGDWILFLDADEQISEKDYTYIKQLVKEKDIWGYSLIQRTYLWNSNFVVAKPNPADYDLGAEYSACIDLPVIRLFRNDPRIRFQGRVHELVEHSLRHHHLPHQASSVVIHHFGKVLDSKHVEEKKNIYLDLGYKKVLDDPENAMAHFELGIQLFELGKLEESIPRFQKGFQLAPDKDLSLLYIAKAYHALGRMEEAEKYYKKCAQLNPGYRVFFEYANYLRDLGYFKKAIALYKKCLAIKPDFGFALFNLGGVCLQMDRKQEGFDCINKALNLNPDNATLHENYGRLVLAGNNVQEGIQVLEKFIEKYPLNPGCSLVLSKLYFKVGDLNSTLKWAQQAKKLNNMDATADLCKAYSLHGLGKIEEALKAYGDVLRQDPKNLDSLMNIASILEGLKRDEEAIPYYARIANLEINNPPLLKQVACKLGRNRTEPFVATFLEKAIAACPEDSECLLLLGSLYEKNGLYEKAQQLYEEGKARIPKIEKLLQRKIGALRLPPSLASAGRPL